MNKPTFVWNGSGSRKPSRSSERTASGLGPRGSANRESNQAPGLEDLLRCLQANSFTRLPTYRKKAMLEGFLEMLRQGREGVITEAGLRILGDDPVGILEEEQGFPAQLIERLVRAAVSEVNDAVRCMVWDVLMKMNARPEAYIRPKDFVRELWSEEPIGRANVINFLLNRFKVDEILEAVNQYVPAGGRKMPVGSCWCLIRYAKAERMVVKRARILRRILDRSEIPAEKATVVFSEVLKALDRFSLVEVFSGRTVDQVPTNWPKIIPTQLDFVFNIHAPESASPPHLRRRLEAIERTRNRTEEE